MGSNQGQRSHKGSMDVGELTVLQKRYSTGGTARGSAGPDTIGEDYQSFMNKP